MRSIPTKLNFARIWIADVIHIRDAYTIPRFIVPSTNGIVNRFRIHNVPNNNSSTSTVSAFANTHRHTAHRTYFGNGIWNSNAKLHFVENRCIGVHCAVS